MTAETRLAIADRPPPQRSRVANGSLHDRSVNGRSAAARRFRDAVAALCTEVGQPLASMPESRRAAVRMAATLIVRAEELQAAMARGEVVDADALVRVSGALARAIDDLGLSPEGLARRKAAEAEAERKRLLDQQFPNRTWDR
jgi:hypothetical protein